MSESHKTQVVLKHNGWTVVCERCGQITDIWAYRFLATLHAKDHDVETGRESDK